MAISPSGSEPITDFRQLVGHLEAGCKPRESWRIGTEHEKFVFKLDTHEPVPYEGPFGIGRFLDGMTRFGWAPVLEGGQAIALESGACTVSLEPGGQLELSGAPLRNLHETCDEVHTHLAQVKEVAGELGVGLIGLGFLPRARREDMSWMPKGRYKVMRAYMPTRGALGLDMMLRSCTVQVNLDYESEADMVEKFRIAMALQPVATALFANSPFVEGKPVGWQSWRSHVWDDTDPDRCGMLPFVFEDGMGFERYVDYALDVPMYFVHRDHEYVDVAGESFRDFLDGRLRGFKGQVPTMDDWADHLTTVFPDVRLKTFLEMRGADGGAWRRLCALPALWTGLLYDSTAQSAASDLTRDWRVEEVAALRVDAGRSGLHATFRGRPLRELAGDVLGLAEDGLRRRGVPGREDPDETCFLATLKEIVSTGRSPSDELLAKYEAEWDGDIGRVFTEYAY